MDTKNNAGSFSKPVTSAEHFLHDLFMDEDFVAIRDECNKELNKVGPGLSQLIGRGICPQSEQILKRYSKIISEKFAVTDDVARQGLLHHKYFSLWSRKRAPSVEVDGDNLLIRISANTRLADIREIWFHIHDLQKDLPGYEGRRHTSSTSLAYAIHKQLIRGVSYADIHRDYQWDRLDGYSGSSNSQYNDFVKYYKETVKGLIKTSSFPNT